MKKVVISFEDYSYECGDGCCTNYGTIIRVNGNELPFHNQDIYIQIEQILTFLGYEVELEY